MTRKTKRRPSRKQLAARRKFVAMARARSRAAKRSRKRAPNPHRRKIVAKRRRRVSARRRRRNPMASVRRRGKRVSQKAWRATGFRRNPRRRRVHHRMVHRRRNPMGLSGIGGEVFTLAKDAVAVMAGGALGRTVTNLIPFGGNTPVMNAGKGVLVAIAIKKLGRRVVSADLADMLAVGALIGPLKDLIVSVAPQAGAFLSGGFAMPRAIGSYAAYSSVRGGGAEGVDTYATAGDGLGAYAEPWQS